MVSNNLPVTKDQIQEFAQLCDGKKRFVLILDFDHVEHEDRFDISYQISANGFTDFAFCRFDHAADANLVEDLEHKVNIAAGIIVAGHEPDSILKVFSRSWCQEVFSRFIKRGGTWFGIGPGATVVGDKMLVGDKTQPGLSLFDGIITTDYYSQHKEIPLRNAYFGSRLQLGIGLNQDEWMVFRDGLIEKKVGIPQVFLRE